jgi:outer membrane protein OmpA-like peptidoglycan-associated protein
MMRKQKRIVSKSIRKGRQEERLNTTVQSGPTSLPVSRLPEHRTAQSLRQTTFIRLQQQRGNAYAQRLLLTDGFQPTVQRCFDKSQAECGCAVDRTTEELMIVNKTADSVIQRDDAPIDAEREQDFQLQVNRDLIQGSLNIVRGRHRFQGQVGLSNPVSMAFDALNINPGLDPAQLQASLSYNNACNEALQSALLDFSMGPFINVDRVPWEAHVRTGIRIGGLRLEPGLGLGFQGTNFDSLLFTINLAHASRDTPSACIASPSPEPLRETPDEDTTTNKSPTPQDESLTSATEEPTVLSTLPTYTLYFFYDSTLIRPESNNDFQNVLELLKAVPTLMVHLTGHTSLEGSDSYNQTLSEERVQAVKNRLMMAEIDPARIHTLAMGESVPAVPEPAIQQRSLHPAVERVRTLNRRVEVHFMDRSG